MPIPRGVVRLVLFPEAFGSVREAQEDVSCKLSMPIGHTGSYPWLGDVI